MSRQMMVRGTGFEPVGHPSKINGSSVTDSPYYSPDAPLPADLRRVMDVWPSLPPPLRAAVMALVGSWQRGGNEA